MNPTAVMIDDVCVATVDRSKCTSYDEYSVKLATLIQFLIEADPDVRFKYHFVGLQED